MTKTVLLVAMCCALAALGSATVVPSCVSEGPVLPDDIHCYDNNGKDWGVLKIQRFCESTKAPGSIAAIGVFIDLSGKLKQVELLVDVQVSASTCGSGSLLNIVIDPVELKNVLGLSVSLKKVVVVVKADGGLLGNLLCALVDLCVKVDANLYLKLDLLNKILTNCIALVDVRVYLKVFVNLCLGLGINLGL